MKKLFLFVFVWSIFFAPSFALAFDAMEHCSSIANASGLAGLSVTGASGVFVESAPASINIPEGCVGTLTFAITVDLQNNSSVYGSPTFLEGSIWGGQQGTQGTFIRTLGIDYYYGLGSPYYPSANCGDHCVSFILGIYNGENSSATISYASFTPLMRTPDNELGMCDKDSQCPVPDVTNDDPNPGFAYNDAGIPLGYFYPSGHQASSYNMCCLPEDKSNEELKLTTWGGEPRACVVAKCFSTAHIAVSYTDESGEYVTNDMGKIGGGIVGIRGPISGGQGPVILVDGNQVEIDTAVPVGLTNGSDVYTWSLDPEGQEPTAVDGGKKNMALPPGTTAMLSNRKFLDGHSDSKFLPSVNAPLNIICMGPWIVPMWTYYQDQKVAPVDVPGLVVGDPGIYCGPPQNVSASYCCGNGLKCAMNVFYPGQCFYQTAMIESTFVCSGQYPQCVPPSPGFPDGCAPNGDGTNKISCPTQLSMASAPVVGGCLAPSVSITSAQDEECAAVEAGDTDISAANPNPDIGGQYGCVGEQCQWISGVMQAGTKKCARDADCVFNGGDDANGDTGTNPTATGRCNNYNKCAAGGGGKLCSTDSECQNAEARCDASMQCTASGAGIACATSEQCANNFLACSASNQCVPGGSGKICSTNDDCRGGTTGGTALTWCDDNNKCTIYGTGIACANDTQCNGGECQPGQEIPHTVCHDLECLTVKTCGADECAENQDCQPACTSNVPSQCVVGGDTGTPCVYGYECPQTGYCDTNYQCKNTLLYGEYPCASNADCQPTCTQMDDNNISKCEIAVSDANDTGIVCSADTECQNYPRAQAANLRVASDNCLDKATFSWDYSPSALANPQAGWKIQISKTGAFDGNNIIFDSGIRTGSANTISLALSFNAFASQTINPNGNGTNTIGYTTDGLSNYFIRYGESYYWRVRVYETIGSKAVSSKWYYYEYMIPGSNPVEYEETYKFPYTHPGPDVVYAASPQEVIVDSSNNAVITFTEGNSRCYKSDATSYTCNTAQDAKFTWSFGDESAYPSVTCYGGNNTCAEGLTNTYTLTSGAFKVYNTGLEICDRDNYCCSASQPVMIESRNAANVPIWKETSPF